MDNLNLNIHINVF